MTGNFPNMALMGLFYEGALLLCIVWVALKRQNKRPAVTSNFWTKYLK